MRNDEFEKIYECHAGALFRFLAYRTGDPVLAEDLVADTFERVLTARRRFDRRKASEKTWIYTIALNLLRDHARRAAVGKRTVDPVLVGRGEITSANPLDTVDERDALRQAMECLSQQERDVIALRFGADLTLPEIARLMGMKLTTAEGRVYRALRKLKEELE